VARKGGGRKRPATGWASLTPPNKRSSAEVADDLGADLVVVGTPGHTPLTGLLLGSVTDRLLYILQPPGTGRALRVRHITGPARPNYRPVTAADGAARQRRARCQHVDRVRVSGVTDPGADPGFSGITPGWSGIKADYFGESAMNTASAQQNRRPFASVINAVAAFFAECNYAQTRLTSLRDTPARF